jgi:hypothetical protein
MMLQSGWQLQTVTPCQGCACELSTDRQPDPSACSMFPVLGPPALSEYESCSRCAAGLRMASWSVLLHRSMQEPARCMTCFSTAVLVVVAPLGSGMLGMKLRSKPPACLPVHSTVSWAFPPGPPGTPPGAPQRPGLGAGPPGPATDQQPYLISCHSCSAGREAALNQTD